jgi:hypothetical protein
MVVQATGNCSDADSGFSCKVVDCYTHDGERFAYLEGGQLEALPKIEEIYIFVKAFFALFFIDFLEFLSVLPYIFSVVRSYSQYPGGLSDG